MTRLNELYGVNSWSYINTTNFEKEIGSNVYGEITQKGVKAILTRFKDHFNENTVFYDLGSGLGKMVIHVGLKGGVKKSIGIEYSEKRHEGALELRKKYAPNNSNIFFLRKNMFDFNLDDATVIYIDNTILSISEKVKDLTERIPPGCLFLHSASVPGINSTKEEIVERTYPSEYLYWFIK